MFRMISFVDIFVPMFVILSSFGSPRQGDNEDGAEHVYKGKDFLSSSSRGH